MKCVETKSRRGNLNVNEDDVYMRIIKWNPYFTLLVCVCSAVLHPV